MKFFQRGEVTRCIEQSLKGMISEERFCELFFLWELQAVEGKLFSMTATPMAPHIMGYCVVTNVLLLETKRTEVNRSCVRGLNKLESGWQGLFSGKLSRSLGGLTLV